MNSANTERAESRDEPGAKKVPIPSGRWKLRLGERPERRDALAHGLLLVLATGAAWRPTAANPWMAAFIAAAVLLLVPWSWRRLGTFTADRAIAIGALSIAVIGSALAGWDPSRAIDEIGLLVATATLVWIASRTRPPEIYPALLAIGLIGLAGWGIWQVSAGLELIRPDLDSLSAPARAYAEERLASRRAFASLPLPSHLAVLLATALPLVIVRCRAGRSWPVWIGSAALAIIGLAATRSPIGIGLGLMAVIPALVVRRRVLIVAVVGSMVIALCAVIVVRPDVAALEPVSLRIDNWRTGAWLWTTSPASGVGVSSFAQASQANPLVVGNRPAHAHSLPVEALSELGPVGFAGVLLLGVWLGLLVLRLWEEQRALAVAVVVIPLHNLADFSLFVSGVAFPWAVLLGWAVAHGRSGAPVSSATPVTGRAAAVAAATLVLAVTILNATSVTVEAAAAASGDPEERFGGAIRAMRLAPWRVQPQFLLATSAIASGDQGLRDRAWNELDRHRWVRPRSAALAERRARLALARGDMASASADLWLASRYGAPGQPSTRAFGELVVNLNRVGDDAAN